LAQAPPPRPLGPIEILISSGNTSFVKLDYATAITFYQRARAIIDSTGKFESHEHFLTVSLNMAEAMIRMNMLDKVDAVLQPALIRVSGLNSSA
jgi:hypothetical protein